MQVVKLFIFSLAILVFHNSLAQKLSGSFESENPIQKKEYFFDGSNRFSTKSGSVFDHGTNFANGYYMVKKDTLFLFFDRMENPIGKSRYDIVKTELVKNDKKSVAIISLRVLDTNQNPLTSALVALYRNDDILSIYPQSDEANYYIQTESKIATHIRILNFETLDVPLDSLWNRKSEIVANIAPFTYDKYNEEYRIEKYLIKEITKSTLILEDLQGNQLNLMKVKVPNRRSSCTTPSEKEWFEKIYHLVMS